MTRSMLIAILFKSRSCNQFKVTPTPRKRTIARVEIGFDGVEGKSKLFLRDEPANE
jgi:hypothetical protein